MASPPRIALIHATPLAVEPIQAAFQRHWPQVRHMNLLDDSLSYDRAQAGRLTDAMVQRFVDLAQYVQRTGCTGILFTCSAFGPCIEAVARHHAAIPVLKPNEAMVADAAAAPGPIGLIATFGPTLTSMPPEFPASVELHCALAEGALDALNRGDADTHDRLIAEQASRLQAAGCKTIALAQFSMARARGLCEDATGLRVLTTVDSAVAELQRRLSAKAG